MLSTRLTESGGGNPGDIKAYAVTWIMGEEEFHEVKAE